MKLKVGMRGLLVAAPFAVAAASQPVQAAEPIQYVKVCSLYGAGFYYIPGTDICMKVGGYVRFQTEYNAAYNGVVYGSSFLTDLGKLNRTVPATNYTTIAVISLDSRQQTAYGTLRTYLRFGLGDSTLNVTGAPFNDAYIDRGFVQIAGFTFGKTQSYFDIFSSSRRYSYADLRTDGDTGFYGQQLAAYTIDFGSGIAASISAEDPRSRTNGVVDGTTASFSVNGVTTTNEALPGVPDIVGNLRVEQQWGYFGVSGALHRVRAAYYGTPDNEVNKYPDDRWGWAVAAGGQLSLPGGDSIGVNAVYSKGATAYATRGGNWQLYDGTQSVGLGWLVDGIFDNATGNYPQTQIELTKAWSVNAGAEHFWHPQLATSVYGGYTRVSYTEAAKNIINTHLPGPAGSRPCGVPVSGSVWPPVTPPAGSGGAACDPGFSFWQTGSRTEWSTVDRSFHVGLDVFYTHLDTAYRNATTTYSANGSKPVITGVDDQSIVSAVFRVQRNIVP